MAPSSSAKKVAKLAQKGKGKKVRFQGGAVFPLIVALVTVLGLSLIIYARSSRPGPGQGAPTANDHWHAAFGVYACDAKTGLQVLPKLVGTLEDKDSTGQFVSNEFVRTGIHSHGDGIMHWHPSTSGAATGSNAKLGVFLNNYNITLTNDKLVLPKEQGGQTFEEGKSKCLVDGKEKDASLKLWVWPNYSKVATDAPQIYVSNLSDVRILNDGMVFMLAFVPDDVKPKAPDWAAELPTLGAADGGAVATTVPGQTTVPGATTVPIATTVPGASTTTVAAGSTASTTTAAVATSTTGG